MTAVHRITAGALSNGMGPTPGQTILGIVLDELAERLTQYARMIGEPIQPAAVIGAESWREPHRAFYTEITIEVGRGRATRSLRSWYQHQHVRFTWSLRASPRGRALEAAE